jgi:hypothetical protein
MNFAEIQSPSSRESRIGKPMPFAFLNKLNARASGQVEERVHKVAGRTLPLRIDAGGRELR